MEQEELQIEHLSSAWVEHVHPADLLSSQSSVPVHWVIGYLVREAPTGSARCCVGQHVQLKVLTVLDVIEYAVLRSTEVAIQLGHAGSQGCLLSAFLEDDVVATW